MRKTAVLLLLALSPAVCRCLTQEEKVAIAVKAAGGPENLLRLSTQDVAKTLPRRVLPNMELVSATSEGLEGLYVAVFPNVPSKAEFDEKLLLLSAGNSSVCGSTTGQLIRDYGVVIQYEYRAANGESVYLHTIDRKTCESVAASAEPVSSSGPAASSTRFATKDEYLACLVAQKDVEARKARLFEQDRKYQAFVAKFRAAETDLAAQVKRHAPTTKGEIESYNRAVTARNESAKTLNAEGRALEQEGAAVNKLVVETNSKCAGLLVSPEVAEAAAAERRMRNDSK